MIAFGSRLTVPQRKHPENTQALLDLWITPRGPVTGTKQHPAHSGIAQSRVSASSSLEASQTSTRRPFPLTFMSIQIEQPTTGELDSTKDSPWNDTASDMPLDSVGPARARNCRSLSQ